jgi:hypothetical protein
MAEEAVLLMLNRNQNGAAIGISYSKMKPPKDTPPLTHFSNQASPFRVPSLQIVYSYIEYTNGLNHSLGQNSCDLNYLWKCSPRHTRYALLISYTSLNPINLKIKFKHHRNCVYSSVISY